MLETTLHNIGQLTVRERQLIIAGQMPDDIYIGRIKGKDAMHYGNPFSHLDLPHTIQVRTREDAVELYSEWLDYTSTYFGLPTGEQLWYEDIQPKRREWIWDNLQPLWGKRLWCWCHPQPCHGLVLIDLIKAIEEGGREVFP